ncbi:hypothetical protein NPIL_142131 [Nephila pilipes]|uniref:Uncharacterized protein n=1 Tax=Nephila pilipes TaxID=299642 RepID=A0A8X6N2D9_NEPPI|nr:hypothetical protein NPIL_142131 [Nephila pilipes]
MTGHHLKVKIVASKDNLKEGFKVSPCKKAQLSLGVADCPQCNTASKNAICVRDCRCLLEANERPQKTRPGDDY